MSPTCEEHTIKSTFSKKAREKEKCMQKKSTFSQKTREKSTFPGKATKSRPGNRPESIRWKIGIQEGAFAKFNIVFLFQVFLILDNLLSIDL